MVMGKMQPAGAAVALAVATMAPGAASAQLASANGLTFAPPTREIAVALSATMLYDSNVASGRSAGFSRALEKEDVRFSPSAQIDLSLPVGPAAFTLAGTAGYNFYARNTVLDRENVDLTGTASTQAGPCAVAAQGSYVRRQTDLVDLSIDPDAEDDNGVNVQNVGQIGGTVSCGAPVGIRPTAFVSYRVSDNSSRQRRTQDFHSWTYGAGLSYSSPTFGILTGYVGRSEFDYVNRDGLAGFRGIPGFDAMQYGLRLDRRLGAKLQVNGSVSYVDVNLPNGFDDSTFNGINWDISATYRATPSLRLTASTGRIIDAATSIRSNLSKTALYLVRADYAISPKLRSSLTASHRTRDFQVDSLSPTLLLTRTEFNDISARVTYSHSQRLSFALGASYRKRDANIALYDFDSFRGSLSASLRL